jgi:hypothetical protein
VCGTRVSAAPDTRTHVGDERGAASGAGVVEPVHHAGDVLQSAVVRAREAADARAGAGAAPAPSPGVPLPALVPVAREVRGPPPAAHVELADGHGRGWDEREERGTAEVPAQEIMWGPFRIVRARSVARRLAPLCHVKVNQHICAETRGPQWGAGVGGKGTKKKMCCRTRKKWKTTATTLATPSPAPCCAPSLPAARSGPQCCECSVPSTVRTRSRRLLEQQRPFRAVFSVLLLAPLEIAPLPLVCRTRRTLLSVGARCWWMCSARRRPRRNPLLPLLPPHRPPHPREGRAPWEGRAWPSRPSPWAAHPAAPRQ